MFTNVAIEGEGKSKSRLENGVVMVEIDIAFEIEANASLTCYLGHVVSSISRMSTIIEEN